MTTDVSGVPAVQYAKEHEGDGAITLSTGVKVRLTPVGGGVLTEIARRVKDPEIPMWHNSDKDTDEPNPLDPSYQRALNQVAQDRSMAVLEAIILMGVDLVDGMPEDGAWIKKLKRVGIEFDDTDPFELEFAYKRFVAVGAGDYGLLGTLSGVTEEAVRKAQAGFRS